MPILAFTKEVVDDSKLLPTLTPDILSEFCRIAVENIRRGQIHRKIYAKAAESLKVSADAVIAAIRSLSRILLEACKHELSASDLALSITDLKLSAQQVAKIQEFYSAHVKEIRQSLSALSLQLPHYYDLDWRLDIQLASRCLRAQAKPVFLLQLHTTIPGAGAGADRDATAGAAGATAATGGGARDQKGRDVKADGPSGGADAVVAPAAKENKEVQWLAADYANIKHLCTELEKAIAQAKSSHTRRIMKYVK